MRIPALIMSALALAPAATRAETITYQYDALGRLKQADQVGTKPNQSRFNYDPAGNRTALKVEGSPNGSATGVIVLPMGSGFTLIPLDRQ